MLKKNKNNKQDHSCAARGQRPSPVRTAASAAEHRLDLPGTQALECARRLHPPSSADSRHRNRPKIILPEKHGARSWGQFAQPQSRALTTAPQVTAAGWL